MGLDYGNAIKLIKNSLKEKSWAVFQVSKCRGFEKKCMQRCRSMPKLCGSSALRN